MYLSYLYLEFVLWFLNNKKQKNKLGKDSALIDFNPIKILTFN